MPGRDPAIVLFHGFSGTPWEVRPVAEALNSLGYLCVAPLLPGHGTSAETLSRTRWDDWSTAAFDHADRWVRTRERVILVGMSLGALLALHCAVRLQTRGVVAVATLGCALKLTPLATGVLTLANALGERMPHTFLRKEGSDVSDPTVRWKNPGYGSNPLRAAREILRGQKSVREEISSLRVPLLALHGLQDKTAPFSASIELVEGIASIESTLVILPHSGHLIGVDRERDEVMRQICSFVQRIDSRGAEKPVT